MTSTVEIGAVGAHWEAYSVQPFERLEWGAQGGEARVGGGSDGGETVMKFQRL